jgi:hypothetical protein
MERKIIRTEDLTIQDLPSHYASRSQLAEFALTFDPVLEFGEWTFSRELIVFSNSSSVKELRSYLYFMQRGWNHVGDISESLLNEMRSAILLILSKLQNY